MEALVDLLREADYWAGVSSRDVVGAGEVRRAIDAQVSRADRVRQRLQEEIVRGSLLVDTEGSRVAQVNGLAALQLGDYAFGIPHRITARVRLGAGRVVDIERESQLGGPIHSKGVLILSATSPGAMRRPSRCRFPRAWCSSRGYGGVEGDSASSAELYAFGARRGPGAPAPRRDRLGEPAR